MDRRKLLNLLIISECLDDDSLILKCEKPKRLWAQERYIRRQNASYLRSDLRISVPEEIRNGLRMDANTYNSLLEKVRPHIEKQNTLMRGAISAHDRLCCTLRFLATGLSYERLKHITSISSQSLSKIIIETCMAIVIVLKEYIKLPSSANEWMAGADEFGAKCQFPHCLGVIVGKHFNIARPAALVAKSYCNYAKTFSIVMLAAVDANCEFIEVQTGLNGAIDGHSLSKSAFCAKLSANKLNIPGARGNLPYVFIGENALPQTQNSLTLYCGEHLTSQQMVYNKRLKRARRVADKAFEILATRFKILSRPINLKPKKAALITLATCHLHNFLRRNSSDDYLKGSFETNAESTVAGLQRDASADSSCPLANEAREQFTKYFNRDE